MIDYKVFRETYCFGCGTQRCMGPEDTDFRDGCPYWRLEKAKDFARHRLPTDKYEHSLRVLSYTRETVKAYVSGVSTDALIVAVLHDIVEDTNTTLEEIEKEFGRYICRCVDTLTHVKEKESYPEYIDRVMIRAPFPEARAVKHADMKDHLTQKETLTPKLKEKYFEVIDRFI